MLACLAQNGRSRLLSRSEDRILGEITTAQFLSGSLRTKSPAPRSHVRGVPSSVARAFFGAALEPICGLLIKKVDVPEKCMEIRPSCDLSVGPVGTEDVPPVH